MPDQPRLALPPVTFDLSRVTIGLITDYWSLLLGSDNCYRSSQVQAEVQKGDTHPGAECCGLHQVKRGDGTEMSIFPATLTCFKQVSDCTH
jgi:hypothetical protein